MTSKIARRTTRSQKPSPAVAPAPSPAPDPRDRLRPVTAGDLEKWREELGEIREELEAAWLAGEQMVGAVVGGSPSAEMIELRNLMRDHAAWGFAAVRGLRDQMWERMTTTGRT